MYFCLSLISFGVDWDGVKWNVMKCGGIYRYKNGLPDETCQVYQAKSDPHDDSDYNVCYNCDPITGILWPGDCYKIDDFTTYYITV